MTLTLLGFDSDYGIFATTGSNLSEGSNPHTEISTSGIVVSRGSDYHLAAGSPAIRAGQNLSSTFNVDIAGSPRPSSGRWDVGAYGFTPALITSQ